LGGVLMVLVQLPFFLRRLRRLPGSARPGRPGRRRVSLRRRAGARRGAGVVCAPVALAGVAVIAPVALFAIGRQAQVFVERFLASGLPPGAISHLNYAQKVAQMPMVLAMMICTVTLPLVARAVADGDLARARARVERDLVLAAVVALVGGAYVVAYAPEIIALLFQRGAFDGEATAATAGVMRVYALGLLGHTLAGALVRPFFSAGRPTWFPVAAMLPGLAVTAAGGLVAVGPFGAPGIAAANAVGITVTALLLLWGLASRTIPVDARLLLGRFARLGAAALAAAGGGWAAASALPSAGPPADLALGCLLVPAVFAGAALALRVPEAAPLAFVLTHLRHPRNLTHLRHLKQRGPHVRARVR
uniref:lipid II flippase MurJ n=1 Tax=Streptomyces sp. SBT349 TaxID=1580539 RepID=UPI000A4DD39A